jgi:hypothetical protein
MAEASDTIPRGTRPDAVTADRIKIFKNVSRLRATYQVRLLSYMAAKNGKVLEIIVPQRCIIDPTLNRLLEDYDGTVTIVRF